MSHMLQRTTVAAALAVLSACAGDEKRAPIPADADAPAQEGQPAGGMEGMKGMAGMQDDGMMQQMQGHMQMMHGISPDSMRAMMPQHRQMAANMLAQMNREMREMNMAGDPEWTATVDSLRQDLTRMPEMGGQELGSFMTAHQARMNRLMEMHRAMMSAM